MKHWLSSSLSLAVLLVSLLAPATPTGAAEMVAPGEILVFEKADSGARECRIKDLDVSALCDLPPWRAVFPIPGAIPPRWVTTYSGPSSNHVGAAHYVLGTIFGVPNLSAIPHYATGKIYNHFEIEDTPQTQAPIDVQVSIQYYVDAFLFGLANYTTEVSVSLEIEEYVGADRYEGVGSLELFSRDRSGDQGFTDVAVGAAAYDLNDESARFDVKLRRGGIYRIVFKAEAYGIPVLSESQSSIEAWWTQMSVLVDEEDASELIRQHDEDIKARLTAMERDLEEIKRLLITPTGRRPGFPRKVREPK